MANTTSEHRGRFALLLAHVSEWSPGRMALTIFLASFIFSLLFTSLILAGVIEIQPNAIKAVLKSIFGKR